MGKKSTIMYNQWLEADEILKEYGDVDNLRLDHILDRDEMEDEISCINPSPYYDTTKLSTFLKDEGHFKGAMRFGTFESIDFKKNWYVEVPVVPRSLML